MHASAHGRHPILSVVLAGGEGKRLMPLTLDRAKPAVPFGGKYRLIDFAISNLVNGGFRHIVVLTQYKSHSLDVHISMTWQLSTILGNYVTTVPAQMRRGPRWYLGSADALVQNMNLIDDEQPEHVIVFGADHIYRMNPRQMLNAHVESGAGVTVAAIRLPASESFQFGAIERGADSTRILGFHEKDPNAPTNPRAPHQIRASMGNYIFSAEAFRDVLDSNATDGDTDHDIGGDIIPKLVASGDAHVYDYSDNVIPGDTGSDNHYWRDVGTLDSYYDAHMDLVAPLPAFSLYNDQWPIFGRGNTEPPARIINGPGGPSEVQNCVLSNGVILSGGRCRDSVLAPEVLVDDGAEVAGSILLGNVTVGKGAKLNRCIIDKNVVIPPGYEIGLDPTADAERFQLSDNGVVAVAKNTRLD
ncbi:MAG: glucose-1-phosphate adenylyltransferase [Actinomycetota bacterium]